MPNRNLTHFCVAILALFAVAQVARAADLPTLDDLQKELADKDYTAAVKDSARLLALKGDAATGIDKYQVGLIKGEAHLQLKQMTNASKAYQQAGEVEGTTEAQQAEAFAMALLTRKSNAQGYTPDARGRGRQEAIDIFNPENRKSAFVALFDAQFDDVKKSVAKAQKTKSIPPIEAAATDVAEVRYLELAADGSDEKIKEQLDGLSAHASEVINEALDKMTQRVGEIEKAADEKVRQTRENNGQREYYYTKRGLSGQQSQELKGMLKTCEQLVPVSENLVKALGEAGKKLDIKPAAETLYKRAGDVLHADYSEQSPA